MPTTACVTRPGLNGKPAPAPRRTRRELRAMLNETPADAVRDRLRHAAARDIRRVRQLITL